MRAPLLLYYITDRTALADDEPQRRARLLQKISEAARAGVDYIQLHEKDLSARELESLASEASRIVAESAAQRSGNPEPRTRLLINSRADVALASHADGVHLRSGDTSPRTVREIYSRGATQSRTDGESQGRTKLITAPPIISVACHTVAEVSRAAQGGADFALFAPVFGKSAQKNAPASPAAGLDALHEACQQKIPVIALGGITLENFRECKKAGAAGIAAIRLFQENNIAEIIRQLRTP
jgi:thiamine-phosphate pyrophosphorylase